MSRGRRSRMGRHEHQVPHAPPFLWKLIAHNLLSSSSGRPALTPGGHARAWTKSVRWTKASAFDPPSYASLVAESTAVVHTLGILMENNYKQHVKTGNLLGLIGSVVRGGDDGNPLAPEGRKGKEGMTYEVMNRDAGMSLLSANPGEFMDHRNTWDCTPFLRH